MELVEKDKLCKEILPGRIIRKAVGKEGPIRSTRMSVGFASYSGESGCMSPHCHAEETVYIVKSDRGYVRFGESIGTLGARIPLNEGMILHFGEMEWHVFEYDEGGKVEIIFIYGQVDNNRPEDVRQESCKR